MFRWTLPGDERQLCDVSLCRYNLTSHTRCNITLVIKLQKDDNNRRWRCLVNTTENSRAVFLDFRSAFLFQNNDDDDSLNPSVTAMCQVKLPISRIVLCVALPIMVTIVAFFTWKSDRERAKASAESFMLHEINWPSVTAGFLSYFHFSGPFSIITSSWILYENTTTVMLQYCIINDIFY